jgi:hypothetical protein
MNRDEAGWSSAEKQWPFGDCRALRRAVYSATTRYPTAHSSLISEDMMYGKELP